jgi:hypothetical protein
MNIKEIESVIKLDAAQRYAYFLKRVADFEEIWVLSEKDSVVLNADKKGKLFLYLFPFEEYAKYYQEKTQGFEDCLPKKIDLYQFKDEKIPKLTKNGVDSAFVFPVPNGWGYNVSFDKLVEDIDNYIEENFQV